MFSFSVKRSDTGKNLTKNLLLQSISVSVLAHVCVSPLVHVVQKVLLEHPAPSLDDIHQRVFEGSDIEL